MKTVIITGSIRNTRTSNRVSLSLLNKLVSDGHEAEIIDLKGLELPKNGERFAEVISPSEQLQTVARTLQQSNALIFVTPEYNGSISAALKHLIDTFGKTEFAGKPIAVATVSTGIMGGVRAAYQLQQIILSLQAYPQPQMLLTGEVTKQLNEQGEIINSAYEAKRDTFLQSFITFAKKLTS